MLVRFQVEVTLALNFDQWGKLNNVKHVLANNNMMKKRFILLALTFAFSVLSFFQIPFINKHQYNICGNINRYVINKVVLNRRHLAQDYYQQKT
jgi:hypothetical protein